jgi:hypothetical protein
MVPIETILRLGGKSEMTQQIPGSLEIHFESYEIQE